VTTAGARGETRLPKKKLPSKLLTEVLLPDVTISNKEVKRKIKHRQQEIRSGKTWAPAQTHKICKSCRGQCCFLSSVVLDREAVDRRLHEFKGDYTYDGAVTARALEDLNRKNTKAPILKRRDDGSCIYFDRKKRSCTIYRRRPHACKAFFCGRGTKRPRIWQQIRITEKDQRRRKKNKEAKLRKIYQTKKDAWKPNREMPMLAAILAGEKLWNSGAPALVQKNEMEKVAAMIREEHDYMLEHEPQDQFHACVLLGALNVIEAALSRRKTIRITIQAPLN